MHIVREQSSSHSILPQFQLRPAGLSVKMAGSGSRSRESAPTAVLEGGSGNSGSVSWPLSLCADWRLALYAALGLERATCSFLNLPADIEGPVGPGTGDCQSHFTISLMLGLTACSAATFTSIEAGLIWQGLVARWSDNFESHYTAAFGKLCQALLMEIKCVTVWPFRPLLAPTSSHVM